MEFSTSLSASDNKKISPNLPQYNNSMVALFKNKTLDRIKVMTTGQDMISRGLIHWLGDNE